MFKSSSQSVEISGPIKLCVLARLVGGDGQVWDDFDGELVIKEDRFGALVGAIVKLRELAVAQSR